MHAFEKIDVGDKRREEEKILYSPSNPLRKDFSLPAPGEAQSESDLAKEQEILEKLSVIPVGAERIEASEYPAEARETLSRIDYDVLRGVFDELRARSGEQGVGGFCDSDRIRVDDAMIGGEYDPKDGITIGSHQFLAHESARISRAEFRNMVLSAVIHEESHASSKNIDRREVSKGLSGTIRSFFGKHDSDLVIGYHRRQFENGKKNIIFRDLNEGVTERIAEEVQREYLRRTGDGAVFSDREHPAEYHAVAYLGSRAMTDAFVEIVAKSSGVPAGTVWEALKQGYMAGVDLRETELERAFEEVFSEGFIERLSEWGSGEHGKIHDEIIRKAEDVALDEVVMGKIRGAFARYHEDRENRLDRQERE